MTEVTRNITNLNNQIGVTPTQRPVGHLPSQPIPNPNHQGNHYMGRNPHYPHQPPPNPPPQQPPRFLQSQAPPPPLNNNPTAHAVTLRSGKTTTDPRLSHRTSEIPMQIDSPPPHQEEKEKQKSQDKISVPFPQALYPTTNKKKKSEPTTEELMELFGQVHINIPLLDAIKYIPAYAKFLKDICTPKRQAKNLGQVHLSETVSSVIQSKLPPKMKDPGAPLISVIIDDTTFNRTLLDLGASVNIIPTSLFEEFQIGELKPVEVTLQLVD